MNNMAEQVPQKVPERVSCLVLPISNVKLLVPITAVAEVITSAAAPEGGDPGSAFYGWFNWRDQRVPLLSCEVFLGSGPAELEARNRIAVINAIEGAADLGYYGILLQGLPRPVQVSGETLRGGGRRDAGKILVQAQIGEDEVIVPALSGLEALAARFSG